MLFSENFQYTGIIDVKKIKEGPPGVLLVLQKLIPVEEGIIPGLNSGVPDGLLGENTLEDHLFCNEFLILTNTFVKL